MKRIPKGLEFHLAKEAVTPDNVFDCGQTFRFHRTSCGFRGVALGSLVDVYDQPDQTIVRIISDDADEQAWWRYLDLERDYTSLFPTPDPVLSAALEHASGLRILRQEPFETLISFIISANNNIPRISRIVEALSTEAGSAFAADGQIRHAFPTPEQLCSVSETRLRELGAGYRASYIFQSARLAADEDWELLENMPTPMLLDHLQAYPGIGPKVAGCIALFGFGRHETFPVDVWIRRILRLLYGVEGSPKELQNFAQDHFGSAAGIAQQYLFQYARQQFPKGR